MHTDEDQPAAIQVEDDEQVAYYDEATGYFYDTDGFYLDLTPDTASQEDAEIVNDQQSIPERA